MCLTPAVHIAPALVVRHAAGQQRKPEPRIYAGFYEEWSIGIPQRAIDVESFIAHALDGGGHRTIVLVGGDLPVGEDLLLQRCSSHIWPRVIGERLIEDDRGRGGDLRTSRHPEQEQAECRCSPFICRHLYVRRHYQAWGRLAGDQKPLRGFSARCMLDTAVVPVNAA